MFEILMNTIVAAAFIFIAAVMIRSMLPAHKLVHNGEKLVCISRGKVFSNERFYFNAQGVFVYRRKVLQAHYSFTDVVVLEKNSGVINNVRMWRLTVRSGNGQSIPYTFCPDTAAFWRESGFGQFYHSLKTAYPDKVKNKWQRWCAGC